MLGSRKSLPQAVQGWLCPSELRLSLAVRTREVATAVVPSPKTHLGCRADVVRGRDHTPDALFLWGLCFSCWFYGLPNAGLAQGEFWGLSADVALRGVIPVLQQQGCSGIYWEVAFSSLH